MQMTMGMVIMMGMSAILMLMFFNMTESEPSNKSEKESFECGFINMNSLKMSFSTNFIMIMMLFLIFDLEISIMIPMMMSENPIQLNYKIPSVFIIVLTILLMKEWLQGTMEWNN